MKILCTCPGFIGVCAVFKHGQSLGLWDFQRFEDLIVEEIQKYDLVILGSWINEYSLILNYAQQYGIDTGVLVTSSIGQMELSPNYVEANHFEYLLRLKKAKKINYLFVGSKPLYEYVKDKALLFPYPFNTDLLKKYATEKKEDRSIGLFLPTAARKNILNQIYAFDLINSMKDIKLHTNISLRLENIKNVEYHDLLPEKKYFNLMARLRLNLHVTHTESFCYLFAESLTLGTPCLISPCIADNFEINDFSRPAGYLKSWLLVENPDSVTEISRSIKVLIEMKKGQYRNLCKEGKGHIENFSKANNKALKELLQNL